MASGVRFVPSALTSTPRRTLKAVVTSELLGRWSIVTDALFRTITKYRRTCRNTSREDMKWSRIHSHVKVLRTRSRTFCTVLKRRLRRTKRFQATIPHSCGDEKGRRTFEGARQKAFAGPSYHLTLEDADADISNLGTLGILNHMNKILRTDRSLTYPMEQLLQFCLDNFTNFGQAYSLLRPRWHMHPSEALKNIETRRKEDREFRLRAVENPMIECPPLRLWDLWSDRVMPFWAVQAEQIDKLDSEKWIAIYHEEADKISQRDIGSSIDGYKRPVPVPNSTALERVRGELLSLAAEHDVNLVWLDVLCRQQETDGMAFEKVSREVHGTTIWFIYSRAKLTVFYLSGLSSPFDFSIPSRLHDGRTKNHADARSDNDMLKRDWKWALESEVLYSCNNEAEGEELEVAYQKAFAGPSYILSSGLADNPLVDLGILGILDHMNEILGEYRGPTHAMHLLLLFCMCTFKDFGHVYSLLRPRWHMDPFEALENIGIRWKEDREFRSVALKNDIVMKPRCLPRRVWDIWSNRVVPFWVVEVGKIYESKVWERRDWLAISHSWVHGDDPHDVVSPINGYEWPIPIPKDTTLDRIRVELLNLSAEHNIHVVWLDVLCLRQKGAVSKESLRKLEWKLDVPTIGPIYELAARTVYYFSGLGRPFNLPIDEHDPRHWMNRAWTLQETQGKLLVAGRSSSSPNDRDRAYGVDWLDSMDNDDWLDSMNVVDDRLKRLMTSFVKNDRTSIWPTLSLMRHRSATSELDKIAGLIHSLNGFKPPLPAYIEGEDPEDAWNRLVKATRPGFRADLFFLFPEPGKGKYVWHPTWQQIKDAVSLPTEYCYEYVECNESSGAYYMNSHYLENCFVKGLSEVRPRNGPSRRTGKVHVVDVKGVECSFSIATGHDTPIADGNYVLISSQLRPFWVVARETERGVVEKVSVIESEYCDDGDVMHQIGESLGQRPLRLL